MRLTYWIREKDGSVRETIDFLEWQTWFDQADRRIIATDVGRIWVSTVFLGIDHQWGDGPPLIYETMAFWNETDPETGFRSEVEELPQERYSTEAEAIAGHERIVAQARELIAAQNEPGDQFDRDLNRARAIGDKAAKNIAKLLGD